MFFETFRLQVEAFWSFKVQTLHRCLSGSCIRPSGTIKPAGPELFLTANGRELPRTGSIKTTRSPGCQRARQPNN